MAISEATRLKLIAAQKARRDSEKKTIEEVKPAKSLAPAPVGVWVNPPVPSDEPWTSEESTAAVDWSILSETAPRHTPSPEPVTPDIAPSHDAFAEWLNTDEGKRASDSRLPSNPMRFRAAFMDAIEIAFKAGLRYDG